MSSVLHTMPKDLLLVIMSFVEPSKAIEVSRTMSLGIEDAYWKTRTADACNEKTPQQIYYLLGGECSDTASAIKLDKPHLIKRKSFSFSDLQMAAGHGSMKAIRHILNIAPRLIKSDGPLVSAIEHWNTSSNLETIHLLLKLKMTVSIHAIGSAVTSGVPLDVLSSLIDKHMSQENKTTLEGKSLSRGLSLLERAFVDNRLYCVELLMSKGCKLKYPGRLSCMHYVQSEEAIKLLLDHGLDVNKPERKTGVTPLFSEYISAASVEALIRHGANLNHQDISGYTPLMTAFDRQPKEVIEAFLRYKDKMDLSLRNKGGDSYLIFESSYPKLFVQYDLIPEGYVRPVHIAKDNDDEADDETDDDDYDETDDDDYDETDDEDDE